MPDRYYSLELAVSGQARTHVPLVAFDEGKLLPAGCGDTPGMFYLVPELTTVFHLTLFKAVVLLLSLSVSAAVLAGIAGFVVLFGNTVTTYLAALVEIFLAWRAFHAGDVYFVAPCVVIALVPWALLAWEKSLSLYRLLALGVCVGTLVGLANLLRDQAGTAVLLFFLVLLGFNPHFRRRVRLLAIVATLAAVALPVLFGTLLLDRRDVYLRSLQPDYIPAVRQHVFWHTAYIGFGFLRNPFVPDYLDEVAVDRVRMVAPNVIYLSAEYDSYLKPAVLELIRHHPSFVMATVFAKLGVLMMYLLLSANVGLVAALLAPKPWPLELACSLGLAVSSLPGIVAVPRLSYVLGFCSVAAMYGVISIGYFLCKARAGRTVLVRLPAMLRSAGDHTSAPTFVDLLKSSRTLVQRRFLGPTKWLIYLCGVLFVLIMSVGLSHSQVTTSARDGNGASSPRQVSPSLMKIMDSRYLQLETTIDGFKKTGVALVAYRDGYVIPAGDGDDPGLFYFVPLISRKMHLSLPRSIDLFLISIVTVGFGTGLAGILIYARTTGVRLFAAVLAGGLLILTLVTGDVYIVQTSFTVAAVPWILMLQRPHRIGLRVFALAFSLGLSSYAMNIVRMHTGSAVLMFASFVLCGLEIGVSRKACLAAIAIAGFAVGAAGFHIVVHQRDAYLSQKTPGYRVIAHHVVWHNIYAGLGFLQNDYGLKWDDSVPMVKVRSIDPHAAYLSPEYENAARTAVLRFALRHPMFIAATLMAKVGVVVLVLLVSANVGLLAAVRYTKPWLIETAFMFCLAFTALPAILAVPHPRYMLSYVTFAAIYGIVSIEYALQLRGRDSRTQEPPAKNVTLERVRKEIVRLGREHGSTEISKAHVSQ